MIYFANFWIGAALASHIGVICDRFLKEDFLFTRSKCNFCQTTLSLLEEIPLLSYLSLRGRCRYCKTTIPALYFFIELIGGFAFLKVDFSNLYLPIFLFYLLVIALFDYQKQEFPTIFLIPLCFTTFLNWLQHPPTYTFIDAIEFLSIFFVLLIYTLLKKLGNGDLILYVLLTLFWKPQIANLIFLLAAVFSILHYSLEFKIHTIKESFPFIPYIYLGLTCTLLYF